MKKVLIPVLMIAAAAFGRAQVVVGNYPIQYTAANPNGQACNSTTAPALMFVPSGTVYTCQNGTYAQITSGGSNGFPITIGSTSISAGSTTTAITGLTIDGVSPTTMGFVDATSSIQTQLNGKATANATVPVVVDTSTPVSVSSTNASEYHFNQNATAGTAITYNLPTAAAGKQFCISNSNNGSAANTGVLTVATSASGQFIIFTDGTLSATGGNITSGGAAADAACVTGVDSTHWMLYTQRGTWTKH